MLSLRGFYHSKTQQETEGKSRQFEESLTKELFTKCELDLNNKQRMVQYPWPVILHYKDFVFYIYIYLPQ